ncbi:MAG: sulfatase-like hydrolase/transferase [Planctomycetes bacterium]|nr:sulfatase-like hydrolase/transferase [Planctomycetota bacterium]
MSVRMSITAAALALLASEANAQFSSANPNVILIVLDDLGTEHLNFYGQSASYPPTPNLDALRQGGILFTKAYSNPMCSPTRAEIMTGRYAFRTGMGYIVENNPAPQYTLPDAEVFLPEMLDQGFGSSGVQYASGLFGKWHLAEHTDYQHPIRNGFDLFYGHMTNPGQHHYWQLVKADANTVSVGMIGSPSGPFDESTWDASLVRSAAVDWINARTTPFFSCVNFSPPHAPHQVPPATAVSAATKAAISAAGLAPGDIVGQGHAQFEPAYRWMIEAVDTEIGRLLGGISPAILSNTMVVVFGDNGAHGLVLPAPLVTHGKRSVYEYGTRVPMIVSGPLVTTPGASCSQLVQAVDLWKTIGSITGADWNLSCPSSQCPAGPLDSFNFKNLIQNPSATALRRYLLTQIYIPNGPYTPSPTAMPAGLATHLRAVTNGTYKVIRKLDSSGLFYNEEAYHLGNDPDELCNLLAQPPFAACTPSANDLTVINVLRQTLTNLSGL